MRTRSYDTVFVKLGPRGDSGRALPVRWVSKTRPHRFVVYSSLLFTNSGLLMLIS